MPTSLSNPSIISLKTIGLSLVLLLAPLFFQGQTLTGLWIGALSNDSATARKDQSFEIALTEYNGKVYGYSRSEFIVDDTLYFIVKRVKGTITGDICQVEDDEIISYNFRGKLDKGVKVTSTFRRNHSDTSWYLAGTWKTNATKKYYAVTGKINLEEEKDLTASKIFPHLEELNLANDIAFYKERVQGPVIVKLAKPERVKTEYSSAPSLASNTFVNPVKPELARAESNTVSSGSPIVAVNDAPLKAEQRIDGAVSETDNPVQEELVPGLKKQEAQLPKTDTKKITAPSIELNPSAVDKNIAQVPVLEDITPGIQKKQTSDLNRNQPTIKGSNEKVNPREVNKTIAENKIPEQPQATKEGNNKSIIPVQQNKQPGTTATSNKPIRQPQQSIQAKPVVPETKPDLTSVNTKTTNQPVLPQVKIDEQPKIDIVKQAEMIGGRKSEFSQMVSFKTDSIELAIYDNGEIDGDTVSVFMNAELILSKQGLKASALKKTIYLKPGQEEFTLVLFAENLGKYPPNTGLLVVHDGDDVYNLRFSSDLQKNAGIIFKRKR